MRFKFLTVLWVTLLSAFFLAGCFDRAPGGAESFNNDLFVSDTMTVDSITETVEETPMPVAADELFDDFFFNFAASRKVQHERVKFPLPVDNYGKLSEMHQQEWRRERFFMPLGYYTLVFNDYKLTALVKDTTVNDVTVERLAMSKGSVTRWHFARVGGLWYMDRIRRMSLKQHDDASFFRFYQRFATDSVFQQESLYDPVIFTGPDPDDDFSTMTGELMPEQWPMFAPWLPSGTLYNIIYSAAPYPKTNFRVMLLRGISNGMQMEMQFVKRQGRWKLKKIST